MTPADIILEVAALMNDANTQSQYNNTNCLPYLNLALQDLQEIFEQNNINYTSETSAIITVSAGITALGRKTGPGITVQYPANLIEIRQMWERQSGVNPFIPMQRVKALNHTLEDVTTSQFIVWCMEDDKIKLLPANQNNDLKIDYVKSMFSLPIPLAQVGVDLPFTNCSQYLAFRTASLCSMYIGENPTRAQALGQDAGLALERVLGIWSKGLQATNTRRQPFRRGYKARSGYSY